MNVQPDPALFDSGASVTRHEPKGCCVSSSAALTPLSSNISRTWMSFRNACPNSECRCSTSIVPVRSFAAIAA
jgi:hypothetical protein